MLCNVDTYFRAREPQSLWGIGVRLLYGLLRDRSLEADRSGWWIAAGGNDSHGTSAQGQNDRRAGVRINHYAIALVSYLAHHNGDPAGRTMRNVEAAKTVSELEVVARCISPVQNQWSHPERIVREGAHHNTVDFTSHYRRIDADLTGEVRGRVHARNRGIQVTLAFRSEPRALRRRRRTTND